MNRSTVANRWNLELIEANYQRWRNDAASVDESWRNFFEGYELAQAETGAGALPVDPDAGRAQAGVTRLVDAYREIGHYLADLDPLKLNKPRSTHEELEPTAFGLTDADLDRTFYNPITNPSHATLRTHSGLAGNVLPDHRRRVHAHPQPPGAQVVARADGARAQPSRL